MRGAARDRQRPGAAAQRDRRGGADRRRPVADGSRLSPLRRSPPGTGRAATRASAASAIRRCAARTSCSTLPACWPRSRPCASDCRQRAGDSHRPGDGRAAGPIPGRPGRADDRPRCRSQPARGRRAGAEPRPDGLLSAHPCRVRCHARQGHRRDPARMAPLVDHWHFTDLPAARAASAGDIAERFGALGVKGEAVTAATHRARATRSQRR